jgi:hypothetical protein
MWVALEAYAEGVHGPGEGTFASSGLGELHDVQTHLISKQSAELKECTWRRFGVEPSTLGAVAEDVDTFAIADAEAEKSGTGINTPCAG